MGLWQNLVAGYDENHQNLLKTFPLSTTTISNNDNDIVVVVLSSKGEFNVCDLIPKYNKKSDDKIKEFIIPVSEKSLGRTNKPVPHPIFDQFKYLCGSFGAFNDDDSRRLESLKKRLEDRKQEKRRIGVNKDDKSKIDKEIEEITIEVKLLENRQKFSKKDFDTNREEYLKELRSFAESEFSKENKAVRSVYEYMKKGTLGKDLQAKNIFPTEKTYILFKVEESGNPCSCLWEDAKLFNSWHLFYDSKRPGVYEIDFITGEKVSASDSHPKKIVSSAANAKLISSNDDKNFTFRGLLSKAEQAVTIGYESSQKVHQFLRYLIASQGIICGEQVIVPFSIHSQGKTLCRPPVQDDDLDWEDDEVETVAEGILSLGAKTGSDYAESIRNALAGYKLDNQWNAHARSAILVLDAATTGRLSITFYREFASAEYLERIQEWHESCKWPLWRKKGDEVILYLGAPSIDKIIQAAFGWPKKGQDKAYNVVRKRARQELIRCIFDNAPVPTDYLSKAICRVSNPLSVTDENGKFSRKRFNSILAVTCAILKQKNYNQKELFNMNIDHKRTDRDYLYGRLLGAADKLEEYALLKKDRQVTAALRYMQTFSMRPFTTWQIIHNELLPYKQQVRNSIADRELQNIYALLTADESENDNPLTPVYLVGYYHERAYIEHLISERSKQKKEESISDCN